MSALVNERFTPALPWVNGTLQTIADRVRPASHDLDAVSTEQRFVVALSDGTGDALALRVHRPRAGSDPGLPLVLLVHGMGGRIDSTYVRATALGLLRAGHVVARVDLRGVGDSAEHSRLLYHGGRTTDLREVLRALSHEPGVEGLALVGYSLGGNATLKLLGEPLEGLDLRAGASVCAPLDLSTGVDHLQRRMLGLYQKFLISRLRVDTLESRLELTETERDAVRHAKTLVEFDDLITAKHNGWRDAAEYYAVNSSAQFLPRIRVPTLVVHAMDDPMIPASSYLAVDWAALAGGTPVRRAITANGGHVGFHEHGSELPWYVERIARFLAEAA